MLYLVSVLVTALIVAVDQLWRARRRAAAERACRLLEQQLAAREAAVTAGRHPLVVEAEEYVRELARELEEGGGDV